MKRSGLFACVITLFLTACVKSEFSDFPKDWSSEIISTKYFNHKVWGNDLKNASNEGVVFVFIDGDGVAWERKNKISHRPYIRSSFISELMATIEFPAFYIARPCYYGTDSRCNYVDWTDGRYSNEVVMSFVEVINKVKVNHNTRIVFVGFSGGGAIAFLLMEKMSGVSGLITFAGNLDIVSWAEIHGYNYLKGSVNPVSLSYGEKYVGCYFFFGEEDEVIPYPESVPTLATKFPNAKIQILPKVSHNEGWQFYFPMFQSIFYKFSQATVYSHINSTSDGLCRSNSDVSEYE